MAPVVSVILPTFDRIALAREAIASVVAQSWSDWELIVVDDGSAMPMRAYLGMLDDPRIRVLLRGHSGNPAEVRNAGAAEARGEYLAFLDSDDCWLPQKLDTQLRALRGSEAGWSCTGVGFIDAQGRSVPQRAGPAYVARSGWILEALLRGDASTTMPTLMVRRSLFADVGGFDVQFVMREDRDLAMRLAAASAIVALPEPLTLVREHDARSTRARPLAMHHRYNAQVYRRVLESDVSAEARQLARTLHVRELGRLARAQLASGEMWPGVQSLARAAAMSLSR